MGRLETVLAHGPSRAAGSSGPAKSQ